MPASVGSGEDLVFGEAVRARRMRLGFTQEELAGRTGLGVRTIRDIETGRIASPRPGTVRLLADVFGLHGPERDQFHQAAHPEAADPVPTTAGQGGSTQPAERPAPAQLPADVAGFTGRAAELARLHAILPAVDQQPSTVVISALSGMAGVGKTTLAVHWAHQVADRFPDGQLYVNLRGFDPAGIPTTPAEALRSLLDALAVSPQQIPADVDGQASLYRSLMAGRRMLVLLDNARDAEQVRPLLPGRPGCMALVTSRNQLTGLAVTEGAQPLTLDLLTDQESGDLLASRLCPHRVAAEPEAVRDIVRYCAGLPLALSIVSARAAACPHFPLSGLAAELREARELLDRFHGGDLSTDLRAVFSWSYQALDAAAARLFRMLAVHPGPHIDVAAAAALTGADQQQARRTLAGLATAHLLTERSPGRYTVHDLLHAYAGEQVRHHEPPAARRAGLRRVLDHYLRTAYAADRLLDPHRPAPAALRTGRTATPFADYPQAMAWLAAERPVLLAAVRRAADEGFHTHCWQLAWALATFLDRQGHWQDLLDTQSIAVRAAYASRSREGQAHTHRGLGRAYTNLGRGDDAHHHLGRALDLFAQLGDPVGQARAHLTRAWAFEGQHQPHAALDRAEQALRLYRAAGDRSGQARARNTVGWYHAQLGHYRQTLDHCRHALALHRQIGDRRGEATTWDTLAHAHRGLGQLDQAIACYQRALELFHQLGDRYHEATALVPFGDVYHDLDDADAARQAWRQALVILDEIGHPVAEQVRDRLHHLDQRDAQRLVGDPA